MLNRKNRKVRQPNLNVVPFLLSIINETLCTVHNEEYISTTRKQQHRHCGALKTEDIREQDIGATFNSPYFSC